MSDIIVAADHAQFGLPEVKVGLFAAAGGAFRLAQQLPKKLAMEYMLTGDPIPAARAAEFGLRQSCRPARRPDARPRSRSRKRSRATRRSRCRRRSASRSALTRMAASLPDAPCWEQNTVERSVLMRSEDAREGPLAFAQKRKPEWKAR